MNMEKNSIPKYKLIAEDIEAQVKNGVLKSGEPMNSELQTQQQYGVSRVTVRKAYKLLLDKGIIRTVHGVGTYINDLYNKDWTWMNSFTTQVSVTGHVPTTKVKHFQIVEADELVARQLGLKEQEECYMFERIRYIDNQPLWITRSYIKMKLAPGFTAEHLSVAGVTQSIFKVLEINYNIKSVKLLTIEEKVEVNIRDAKYLKVNLEQLLLIKTSVTYDDTNHPIVYEETTMVQPSHHSDDGSNKDEMKLAASIEVNSEVTQEQMKTTFEQMKHQGVKGVEVLWSKASYHQWDEWYRMAQTVGVELISNVVISEEMNLGSDDESVRQQSMAYLKEYVDKTASGYGAMINSTFCVKGDSKASKGIEQENILNAIRSVGKYAREKNIVLNIEIVNRFETGLANRIEEACKLLKLIGLDNVKLLVNTFHMNIEEDDFYKSLEQYLPYIGLIRVSENHRGLPGTGHINWHRITGILKRHGYKGYLELEAANKQEVEIERSIELLMGLMHTNSNSEEKSEMMNEFEFFCPTKIELGENKATTVGDWISKLGINKPIVVTDKILMQVPVVSNVIGEINNASIFDDVLPNPTSGLVMDLKAFVEACDGDGLIVFGGGSAIDAAKAASIVAYTNADVTEYYDSAPNQLPILKTLPLIVIPTTSGTGSEVSKYSVITDGTSNLKESITSDLIFPRVSIIDPVLATGMPPSVTVSTGLDALSHALESLISSIENPLTNILALRAIELIIDNLNVARLDGNNMEARSNMCFAATIAGIAMSHCCGTMCHAMGCQLTSQYGVPHGLACAVIQKDALDYAGDKVANVKMLVDYLDKADYPMTQVISTMKYKLTDLFSQLETNMDLENYHMTDTGIEIMAVDSMNHGCMGLNPVKMQKEEIIAVFEKLK